MAWVKIDDYKAGLSIAVAVILQHAKRQSNSGPVEALLVNLTYLSLGSLLGAPPRNRWRRELVPRSLGSLLMASVCPLRLSDRRCRGINQVKTRALV